MCEIVCGVCRCVAEAWGPACVVVVASEVSAAPAALCTSVYVSACLCASPCTHFKPTCLDYPWRYCAQP